MDKIDVKARLENLYEVQEFVSRSLSDCSPKLQGRIATVVDEVFSNIASYAYDRPDGNITVRVTVNGDIVIEFEDSGVAFNPLQSKDPDITLAAEDRQIGGLGLFIVKKLMDSVEYRRDGAKNILRIRKKLE